MAYVQFIIPNTFTRKSYKRLTLELMRMWAMKYEVTYEQDLAGFELNFHFSSPQSLTLFLIDPPPFPVDYKIVE